MLELNPAYLLRKFAEFFYQYVNISYHILLFILDMNLYLLLAQFLYQKYFANI